MISAIISRISILVFGTLYPAYASYKAVRTKNVKEYVKWMMYWIVYAFFTCIETFTDIFLSWFPFYYEVKVLVVLWLLSPATKGSSVLYRKFVHPMLTRREQEIDDYLNQAKERGYTAVIQLGSKGVNYATNVIMQTALKGGGNLVQTIRRSYSLSDLSEPDVHRTQDEIDEIIRPQQPNRILRQRHPNAVTRSSSGSRHSTGMYFSEIDVAPKAPIDNLNYNIRSSEDISSGYSSAEPVSGGLSRTSSMTSANKLRFRAKRAENDNFSENEENEYLTQNSLSSQYPQNFYDPKNPLTSSPPIVTSYPIQSNYSDSPTLIRPIPRLIGNDIINDWKDENFFENEEYLKKSSTSNIDKDLNVSPDMKDKYEMFCQWLENNKNIKDDVTEKKNIKKQFSDDDFMDTISVNSDDGLEKFIDIDSSNDKIEIKIEDKPNEFDKIEEIKIEDKPNEFDKIEEIKIEDKPNEFDKIEEIKIEDKPNEFDKIEEIKIEDKPNEFDKKEEIKIEDKPNVFDKIEETAENLNNFILKLDKEEIHQENNSEIIDDIKNIKQIDESKMKTNELLEKNIELINKIEISIKNLEKAGKKPLKFEPFEKVIVQNNSQEVIHKMKAPLSREEHDYEEVNFVNSSLSELKRPAYHGKGKAPIPPTPLIPPKCSSEQSNICPKTPPAQCSITPSLYTSATPTPNILLEHQKSRSPSPKPESTKIKPAKKSLFRSYLPSIFRSESPKPIQTKSDDDNHRETEI